MTEENSMKRVELNKNFEAFQIIFGCKWSLTIFSLIRKGVNRPGKIEKTIEGLSTKVMNQCLKKSVELKILEKVTYNELPPRTEYNFTQYGQKFLAALDEIEKISE